MTIKPDPTGAKLPAQQVGQLPEGNSPEQPLQTAEAAQGSKPQSGLTLDDIRAVMREEMDSFQRGQQSARDKQERRIMDNVAKQIAVMQKAGVQVTDTMRASVEQTIREEAGQPEEPLQNPPPAQGNGAEPSKPTQNAEVNDPLTVMVLDLEKEYGIELNESDPEATQINHDSGPRRFLQTYEAALQAKRVRVNAPSPDATPGATVPMMGGGNQPTPKPPAHAGLNGAETIALAFKDFARK